MSDKPIIRGVAYSGPGYGEVYPIRVDADGHLYVDMASPLPAGTNNIGDVDVLTLPALPAGTNNIGDVDVLTLPSIPAGTNNIGDVDVLTVKTGWEAYTTAYSNTNLGAGVNSYVMVTLPAGYLYKITHMSWVIITGLATGGLRMNFGIGGVALNTADATILNVYDEWDGEIWMGAGDTISVVTTANAGDDVYVQMSGLRMPV